MFRTDGDGNDNNRYTEGDPQTAVPATVVTDAHLNAFQEEIITPIEKMGITLVKGEEDQLWLALLEMALRGGRDIPVAHTLANNSGPITVANFPVLNKSNHLLRVSFFYIERKTDTQNVQEAGILMSRYDSADDEWIHESFTLFDDSGTVFSIDDANTDAAILEVTTDDLTGTTYVGVLKMTQLFEVRV